MPTECRRKLSLKWPQSRNHSSFSQNRPSLLRFQPLAARARRRPAILLAFVPPFRIDMPPRRAAGTSGGKGKEPAHGRRSSAGSRSHPDPRLGDQSPRQQSGGYIPRPYEQMPAGSHHPSMQLPEGWQDAFPSAHFGSTGSRPLHPHVDDDVYFPGLFGSHESASHHSGDESPPPHPAAADSAGAAGSGEGHSTTVHERQHITPVGADSFIPHSIVKRIMPECISTWFLPTWTTLSTCDPNAREVWFAKFRTLFTWDPAHETWVKKNFVNKCAKLLRDSWQYHRKSQKRAPNLRCQVTIEFFFIAAEPTNGAVEESWCK